MKTEESYMKMLRELLKLTGEREITSDRSSAAITWTSNGKPVANEDLWQLVAEEAKIHKITVFLI